MKLQLLPTSFDENGCASQRQHLSCFVIDDCVAIDAGTLAMATDSRQRKQIRDVVLTHAHLDHIAGLPLFIDDLFDTLEEPVRVYALDEVIETIRRNIFNWEIYPDFSELKNKNGAVLEYFPIEAGQEFAIKHLRLRAVEVNHRVASSGFVISDGKTKIGLSSDTAETNKFWTTLNEEENLGAILIECAFPDELEELAQASYHLTPKSLKKEIAKYKGDKCPIYAVNIKPMYLGEVARQIEELKIENLKILQVGKVYQW
ncbi:MAG: 3',5'-cyclic-nucleotide phosphodiesterase [Acidobacteriota bacterium]|nr:3',5'-cyclic-nucleotide phosphodiesterase [Acidobacteriota bacterium]